MARRAGIPDRFSCLDQHYYYRTSIFLLSITKHLALHSEHGPKISHEKNLTYRYAAQPTDLTVRGYEVAAVVLVAGKNAFMVKSEREKTRNKFKARKERQEASKYRQSEKGKKVR